MSCVTILLSFTDILSKVCGTIGNPKLYLPDCICSLRFALTLMVLASIGVVTSEQQLRFSLKKKNMTLDYTVVLNCLKQRGLILISDIKQEGCSRRGRPCGSGGPQLSVLL